VSLSVQPNDRVNFALLHQDDDLLVIDKPAGVVSTPGRGHEHDSLQNGLFARFGPVLQNVGADRDYGMLQRLDRDASGVMLVALRPASWEALRAQFAARRVRKYYWALCRRAPSQSAGVIRKPLEEHMAPREDLWQEGLRKSRQTRVKLARVSARGKPAVTAFRTIAATDAGALLECRAVTGRLHQVRAHLDSIGCSILGDRYYGPRGSRQAWGRLGLHAHRILFQHPSTGLQLDLRSKLPKDLKRMLRGIGIESPGVFTRDGADSTSTDSSSPETI
jgi:23S rRNA pseudouridine1911/1915/1917 synthase